MSSVLIRPRVLRSFVPSIGPFLPPQPLDVIVGAEAVAARDDSSTLPALPLRLLLFQERLDALEIVAFVFLFLMSGHGRMPTPSSRFHLRSRRDKGELRCIAASDLFGTSTSSTFLSSL